MSIHDRVNQALVHALHHRPDKAITTCGTCNGQRLVVQLSPEMHDAWAAEVSRMADQRVNAIRHYLCVPVRQLPHLPTGTVQVADCWDCTELPTLPDDPDAIARFLT